MELLERDERYSLDYADRIVSGHLESRFLGLELSQPVDLSALSSNLSEMDLEVPFEIAPELGGPKEATADRLDYSTWRRFLENFLLLVRSPSRLKDIALDSTIEQLTDMVEVNQVGRLFLPLDARSNMLIVYDGGRSSEKKQFIVWFKPEVTESQIREAFEECGIQDEQKSRHFRGKYLVSGGAACLDNLAGGMLRFIPEVRLGLAKRERTLAFGLSAEDAAPDPTWHLKLIKADAALTQLHESGKAYSYPIVAALDLGFDVTREFLRRKVAPRASNLPGYEGDAAGWNFLSRSNRLDDICPDHVQLCPLTKPGLLAHGHAIAALAAADGACHGIAGVSPCSQLLLLVRPNNDWDLGEALGYARDRGARIVVGTETQDDIRANLRESLTTVEASGVAVFYAAGNDSDNEVPFPAGHSAVAAVGASARSDAAWFYTNRTSDNPRLWAPSGHHKPPQHEPTPLWTAGHDGLPAPFGGTSGAAPILAGAAALALAANPKLTPQQVRDLLFESGAELKEGSDPNPNYRRVDVLAAVQRALST